MRQDMIWTNKAAPAELKPPKLFAEMYFYA